jgi:hypothetical protein
MTSVFGKVGGGGDTGGAEGGAIFLDLFEKWIARKTTTPAIINKKTKNNPSDNRAIVLGSASITSFISHNLDTAFYPLLKEKRPMVTNNLCEK